MKSPVAKWLHVYSWGAENAGPDNSHTRRICLLRAMLNRTATEQIEIAEKSVHVIKNHAWNKITIVRTGQIRTKWLGRKMQDLTMTDQLLEAFGRQSHPWLPQRQYYTCWPTVLTLHVLRVDCCCWNTHTVWSHAIYFYSLVDIFITAYTQAYICTHNALTESNTHDNLTKLLLWCFGGISSCGRGQLLLEILKYYFKNTNNYINASLPRKLAFVLWCRPIFSLCLHRLKYSTVSNHACEHSELQR